jgi:hypothetical protein
VDSGLWKMTEKGLSLVLAIVKEHPLKVKPYYLFFCIFRQPSRFIKNKRQFEFALDKTLGFKLKAMTYNFMPSKYGLRTLFFPKNNIFHTLFAQDPCSLRRQTNI